MSRAAGATAELAPGTPVVVTGLGVSGEAAARALLRLDARVVVVDARAGQEQEERARPLRDAGAEVVLGPSAVDPQGDGGARLRGAGLVVTSPGWRPDHPFLLAAADAGVPVWGEAELAWRLPALLGRPEPEWLALTGTNGKTTTVRMLAAVLRAAGRRAVAAGNVGTALCDAVLADPPPEVLAVELSSFQLHWSSTLAPQAAALLNVAPDHLDWHGSLAAYEQAKARVWASPATAVAVGTADDEASARLLAASPAPRHVAVTLAPPRTGQLGVVETLLVDRAFVDDPVGGAEELASLADLPDSGDGPAPHVVLDALAAAALARAVGVPADAVREGLAGFRPDPHRSEVVARAGGVTWVDDSKATNPHAAAASLTAGAPGSVVWVAGGLAKGATFDDLVAGAADRLAGVVLLGQDREVIADALARHAPQVPVVRVDAPETGPVPPSTADPSGPARLMAEVVSAAAGLARPGSTVLLAPACASMDQFRDYGERGRLFAAAAAEHAGTVDGGTGSAGTGSGGAGSSGAEGTR